MVYGVGDDMRGDINMMNSNDDGGSRRLQSMLCTLPLEQAMTMAEHLLAGVEDFMVEIPCSGEMVKGRIDKATRGDNSLTLSGKAASGEYIWEITCSSRSSECEVFGSELETAGARMLSERRLAGDCDPIYH